MNINILVGNKCTGCMACANICPQQCISFIQNNEGFGYPRVEEERCIHCNKCNAHCPVLKMPVIQNDRSFSYAVINKNSAVRLKSSSGGVFSLLAEYVLQRSGIVFGAAFNEKWEVVHTCIKDTRELYKLRGSKYVQSYIGNTYNSVKAFLDAGKEVLFSGTPCQIGGLKAFLQREYSNLITVDLICHGVPSPLVWKKYVEVRSKDRDISSIFFRSKNLSWERFLLEFEFQDSSKYLQPLDRDVYLRGFLANLYLRRSCYECPFKGINRLSDFTLADFWGIDEILPALNDHKGISLVFCHNLHAKTILNSLNAEVVKYDLSKEQVLKYNSAMIKSSALNTNREKFFLELTSNKYSIDRLIYSYVKEPYIKRIYRFIKRRLISSV